MTNFKRAIALLFLLAAMYLPAFAGNPSRVGTAGANQLLIPVGSSGIAMGSSVIASTTGIEALYWNPAGLAGTSINSEAMFSTMSYIADINVANLAVTTKMGGLGSIGISLKSLSFGQIPLTTLDDPDGASGVSFSPTFLVAGVTYSRAMTDKIYFGVTTKVISERIQASSATGIGFDIGLQYVTPVGLRVGLAIKNLGTTMKYDGPEFEAGTSFDDKGQGSEALITRISSAAFDIPSSLELGLAYSTVFTENNYVTVAGNFQNNNFASDEYRVGLEYSFRRILFLRGGYNLYDGASDDYAFNGATFGAGFQYTLGGVNFGVDYAYRSAGVFSANQVLTVKLGF